MNEKSMLQEKSPSEIHKNHRARRKTSFLEGGFKSFSDIEKLEFILFYAISQKDTNPIAHNLLDTFGSFKNVLDAPVHALAKVKGMGMHSAILINTIAQSLNAYTVSGNLKEIKSSNDAKVFIKNFLFAKPQEHFVIICLSPTGKVLLTKTMTDESSRNVDVAISLITKTTLNVNCNKIIIGHNHPNGIAQPSDEDVSYTYTAFVGLLMNDIDLIDHIIVTNTDSFSMVENGHFKTFYNVAHQRFVGNKKIERKLRQRESSYIVY